MGLIGETMLFSATIIELSGYLVVKSTVIIKLVVFRIKPTIFWRYTTGKHMYKYVMEYIYIATIQYLGTIHSRTPYFTANTDTMFNNHQILNIHQLNMTLKTH